MAKKIGTFLKELLQKAGVNVDTDAFKAVLETPEMQTVEVPDEVTTGIDNGLLSLEAAKNKHPEIKRHYFAQAYNGLDDRMNALMDELGIPDDVKSQLLAEKSSPERAALIAKKIKELEGQRHTAGKGEKEQLNQEITKLNNELAQIKQREKAIHDDYAKKLKEKDKNYAMRNVLADYKTIYDELPADIKDITLNAIINKELAAQNGEFVVDEAGNMTIQKKDGMTFFGSDHRPLNPKAFIDQVFATNKILKVSENGGGGNNSTQNNGGNNSQQQQRSNGQNSFGNNQQQGNSQNNNNNNSGRANTTLQQLTQQALSDIEKSVNPIQI